MTSILTSLVAFAAAASLLTITPGLDTALVLRTAASEGRRRAALAALGIALGCLTWAAVVALGLGAVLAASRLAYDVIRWLGAAYLIWLGVKLLSRPRDDLAIVSPAPERGSVFARGLATNLLNPKAGVFYVSFLPAFVPHGVAVAPFILILGAIHASLALAWFACLIAATAPIAAFLRAPRVVQSLDRLTGGLFVIFGVGLALEARR